MSRQNRTAVNQVVTRDPAPQTRDPVIVPAKEAKTERQHPVIIRVDVPKCSGCGHTVFRNGGTTIPNVSTLEMLRYRKCGNCGLSFYLAYPMSKEQIEKHQTSA